MTDEIPAKSVVIPSKDRRTKDGHRIFSGAALGLFEPMRRHNRLAGNAAASNVSAEIETVNIPSDRLYKFVRLPESLPNGKQRKIVLSILSRSQQPMTLEQVSDLAGKAGLEAVGGVTASCRYHLWHLMKDGSVEVVEASGPGRFKAHRRAEMRKSSAVKLIKLLLQNRTPEILTTHLRDLLTRLLWKITEAESHKYKTRFQSLSALACTDEAQLRHEHVYQNWRIIDELLNASLHEVDEILKKVVACTVTAEEHERLKQHDNDYGWERYRKAHIEVMNTEAEKMMDLGG